MSTNLDGSRIVKIEDVKKGEFLKLTTLGGTVYGTKVYTKGDYDRSQKKYELKEWDDISGYKYINKGRLVLIDFTY